MENSDKKRNPCAIICLDDDIECDRQLDSHLLAVTRIVSVGDQSNCSNTE